MNLISKSEEQRLNEKIKQKADRLVALTSQQKEIKSEIDEIKAWFENLATNDLKDTKKKTIDYWGSDNSKVIVGNSETVKPISMTMVKKLLGDRLCAVIKKEFHADATAKNPFAWISFEQGNDLIETLKRYVANEKRKCEV